MFTVEKRRVHPKSFHHRIKDVAGHLIDQDQFMGIDPFDSSKFHDIYEDKNAKKDKKSK
ncbi:MAG: hypothetical protein JXQ90_11250 [Cyclobacteriaceae bacterium]